MLRLPPFSLWHCRPAPGQTEGCSVTQAQRLLPWPHVDSEPDRAKDTRQGWGDAATPSPTCPCLQGWSGYNVCLFEGSLVYLPASVRSLLPSPEQTFTLSPETRRGGCTGPSGFSQGGPGGNHRALWDRGSGRFERVCRLLGCGCVRSSRGLLFQVLRWRGANRQSWPFE